ncbi:MAG: hypothetical protein PHV05_08890, partial [Candidatus Riflebacteria bacterium]|nr:hypothetical protein [Candidatus Riflebacteria bacterium]
MSTKPVLENSDQNLQAIVAEDLPPPLQIGCFLGHPAYLPHAQCLADSIQRCLPQAELTVVLQHTCPVDLKGIRELRFVLPEEFRAIPFIDKMFAAAAFEEKATCPLLWLDIDSLFLKTPEFTSNAALRLNPVDKRNIGNLYGEERSLLWQILMSYFALDP